MRKLGKNPANAVFGHFGERWIVAHHRHPPGAEPCQKRLFVLLVGGADAADGRG
jgi:hypothetical protein